MREGPELARTAPNQYAGATRRQGPVDILLQCPGIDGAPVVERGDDG